MNRLLEEIIDYSITSNQICTPLLGILRSLPKFMGLISNFLILIPNLPVLFIWSPNYDLKDNLNCLFPPLGNKKYLPVFKMPSVVCHDSQSKGTELGQDSTILMDRNSSDQNEQLVVYKGALLDVEKLLQQLKRSEKARGDTEEKMREMQEELGEMHEAASISEQNAQKLSVELEQCNNKLKTSNEELRIAQIQVEKYQRALGMCRDQLHLLLGSVETSLEGSPTIITNSRKPISYSIITKSERTDTHNQDMD